MTSMAEKKYIIEKLVPDTIIPNTKDPSPTPISKKVRYVAVARPLLLVVIDLTANA